MEDQGRSEPLRVAVIGTGFGARVQLPGFQRHPETTVVALCGASEEKTAATARQFGVRAVYTDYEQMLVDVQPDLVSIVTPPRWHSPMVLAALQGGAHVLCEKPFALNAGEAEEMLAEAQHYGRVHVMDHEFRYLPARNYQHALVEQGYIGTPLLLEATFMAPMRWDPARPWNWWMDREQGGGVWGAIGSHFVDGFRWLSGREVRAVLASLHAAIPERPLAEGGMRAVTADDTATAVLDLEDGLRGVINLSAVAGGDTLRLAVHGTEGALVAENDRTLWGRRRDEPLREIEIPAEYNPPAWAPDDNLLLGPFVRLVGLMVDQIQGRPGIEPPTFADGLAIQRVLDAGYRSSQEGQWVEIAAGE